MLACIYNVERRTSTCIGGWVVGELELSFGNGLDTARTDLTLACFRLSGSQQMCDNCYNTDLICPPSFPFSLLSTLSHLLLPFLSSLPSPCFHLSLLSSFLCSSYIFDPLSLILLQESQILRPHLLSSHCFVCLILEL